MKTFYAKFKGYYPVGACAVVVADDKAVAKQMLEDTLLAKGLQQSIPIEEIEEFDPTKPQVYIVLDGEY